MDKAVDNAPVEQKRGVGTGGMAARPQSRLLTCDEAKAELQTFLDGSVTASANCSADDQCAQFDVPVSCDVNSFAISKATFESGQLAFQQKLAAQQTACLKQSTDSSPECKGDSRGVSKSYCDRAAKRCALATQSASLK